jgi:hypothetical protein
MKKYLIILVIGAMVALTACGSGSTTNGTNDSTTVVTDTVKVDTTNAVTDTVKLK